MLPTHGTVTSVVHLANALRFHHQEDVDAWVRQAQAQSAFMAGALNHRPVAALLLQYSLAEQRDSIYPTPSLLAIPNRADRSTLLAIAALLLRLAPPVWLRASVEVGVVLEEQIPEDDLRGLSWMGPDLHSILLTAADFSTDSDDTTRLGIGLAAEFVVLSALNAAGSCPVHVSPISDNFGYDITSSSARSQWEVKAARACLVSL